MCGSTERRGGVCNLRSDRLPPETLHRIEEPTITETDIQQRAWSRASCQTHNEACPALDFHPERLLQVSLPLSASVLFVVSLTQKSSTGRSKRGTRAA
jgi:hypothetical protein